MSVLLLRCTPALVASLIALVLVLVELSLADTERFHLIRRIEWASFDWRVRLSSRFETRTAAKLGIVVIDDNTLEAVESKLGHRWPFPRWVHGMVMKELKERGVRNVAYDIFFVRAKEDSVPSKGKPTKGSSDQFFAQEMRRQGGTFLGVPQGTEGAAFQMPASPFHESAKGFGHAVRSSDDDGIVRRVHPFIDDPESGRLWQLGFVIAADRLGADLNQAEVNDDEIILIDRAGTQRRIPLDESGMFLIRWSYTDSDSYLFPAESLESVLGSASIRNRDPEKRLRSNWQDFQIIIGSSGSDPSIADRGPTAAAQNMPFFVVHLDVANSILTDSFVIAAPRMLRLGIILCMAIFSAYVSWRLKALWATMTLAVAVALYVLAAIWLYGSFGYWIPLALPVIGAVGSTHGVMVVWRLLVERGSQQNVRRIFQPVLAPDALEMVLQQPSSAWKSEAREMTVFFADIRGFSELTDRSVKTVETDGAVREVRRTSGDALALETVNLYLSTVVDAILEHGAFIDKYMGDCVMAFWGAPLKREDHAAAAVRAAIAAQQAVNQLSDERARANLEIEKENAARGVTDSEGPDKTLLPILSLGTGINTGEMTVGFMGSKRHLSNYTVFGRAVNIASRLEGASGSGRIFTTEETRSAAISADPDLESLIADAGPLPLKGIANPVKTYQVIWGLPEKS